MIKDRDKVLRIFGHELTEQMKKITKLNDDETMEDFIYDSAFQFLDEFEWKFGVYTNGDETRLKFLRPFGRSKTKPLTESEIREMAKTIERVNVIVKICEYKTKEDFIYDATHTFLDRIDGWFGYTLVKNRKPSKAFHFDSETENIEGDDSKVRARRKFQIIMHKEFLSYIRNLP